MVLATSTPHPSPSLSRAPHEYLAPDKSSPIKKLPLELMVKVLSDLDDWRTLVICTAVCQSWRTFIHKSTSLQYTIELGADGLIDCPSCRLSSHERLSRLLARRSAWRTLEWQRKVSVPTPGECQAYELVGGLFAKAMNAGPGWDRGARHMTMSMLPTATDKEEPRMLVREDMGIALRDFAIDPSQDLIALVEQPKLHGLDETTWAVNVHLRTISTNQTHPHASVPVLIESLEATFNGSVIQILDDIVALFFWVNAVPRLFIWQWTTGKLLIQHKDDEADRFVDDFSLLSSRAYMLTSRFPAGALKVHTFAVFPNGEVATRETSLLLPALTPLNAYTEFTSHTAPFTARTLPGAPFTTAEEVRTHVLHIATSPTTPRANPGGHTAAFTVVVRNRALLAYAQRVPTDMDAALRPARAPLPAEVPWEEWGPANSRFLLERHRYAWLRYVHGARFIRAKHGAWPSIKCRMQVLDFNVHPRRAGDDDGVRQLDVPGTTSDIRYVTEPTTIHDPLLFRDAVESRLPYREVTRRDEYPYSGFMIDDERIVGLSATAFANNDMRQVDVFTF